eukprot:220180-Rhodomonas_salina.3
MSRRSTSLAAAQPLAASAVAGCSSRYSPIARASSCWPDAADSFGAMRCQHSGQRGVVVDPSHFGCWCS